MHIKLLGLGVKISPDYFNEAYGFLFIFLF